MLPFSKASQCRLTSSLRTVPVAVRHFTSSTSTQQAPLSVGFYCHGKERFSDNSKDPLKVYNPATNEHIANVSMCTKEDVEECIDSAKIGARTWGIEMGPVERSRVMYKAADLIERNGDEIALMETKDTGHCIVETRSAHVDQAVATLRYYAGVALTCMEGKHIPLSQTNYAISQRYPYGVTGAIVAWNYPFNMALYKSSILLAGGNSIVMKPSSKTPINTIGLAQMFTQAGLPDGVFNVIQGNSMAGTVLCESDKVDKVSFTGSTPVGEKILHMCSKTIKPATLELGGKGPLIIFDDVVSDTPGGSDPLLQEAVQACLIANFYSAGEICTNGTRVFVHDKIYDQFLSLLKQETLKLRVGDPEDPNTQIGCLIDVGHADNVRSSILAGIEEGGQLICGGVDPIDNLNSNKSDTKRQLHPDCFIKPTIFSDVTDNMSLATEEIFGPVLSVLRFTDTDEVISRANDSPFGLAGGLFTKDLIRANYVSSKLDVGIVWVNTYNIYHPSVPVGGFKQSGFGREFGVEAVEGCTHTKSVYFEMGKGSTAF